MNLSKLCRLAAVVILLSTTQAAFAQYEMYDKSRVGVALAVMRPSGSQLKNINGYWLGATLDVHLKYDSFQRPTMIASMGWFGNETSTARASFVPLRFTYIKRFSQSESGGWYLGGGLDVYYVTYHGLDYDPFTRNMVSVSQSGTPLGINLLGGLEFGGAWYGEVRMDMVKSLSLPTTGSVDFSGMTFLFGSRLAF
jgi:hypothetical protein